MTTEQFMQLQRDIGNCPRVWLTFHKDDEWTGAVYDTKEAAEVDLNAPGHEGMKLRSVPLLDKSISERTWTR